MPTPIPALRRSVFPGCLIILAGLASAADPPVGGGAAALRSHIQPVGDVAVLGKHLPAAGLVTARAPDIVREQLALPRGRGLVVMTVAPDSLASRAGIRRHDVLVAIDGQWLLLPEQLEALIDTAAPDAPLECRLIRAGKPLSLSLSGRPLPEAIAAAPTEPHAPTADAAALPASALVATAGSSPLPDAPAAATAASSTPKTAPAVTSAAGTAAATTSSAVVPTGATRPVSEAASAGIDDRTVLQADADYTLKLTPGAGMRLVVQDRRGRVLFNGPIDTPAQRSRIPLPVRARVEAMERQIANREYRPPQPSPRVVARTTPAGIRSTPKAEPVSGSAAAPKTEPAADRGAPAADPAPLDVEPVEIR
ncbi:MAG: PDZ domain-containing protein [Planctomycetia bacterium]|nr:PDZ domain-containing protein [Planctomycetia bacterium]